MRSKSWDAGLRPGERTNPEGRPVRNRILLDLPDTEYQLLRPHLEFQEYVRTNTLYEPNRRIDFLHFPNCGMISMVVEVSDGRSVEAGIVGCEGVVGTPSTAGFKTSPLRAMVQVPGDGFRVRTGVLEGILPMMREFDRQLGRQAVLQWLQAAQTAACNRLHELGQRLARWLLMVQDRVSSAILAITHDFLAMMLGTDRPSVSLAAAELQRRHLIEYRRGSVRVLNRKKLESVACECYGVVQQYNGAAGLC